MVWNIGYDTSERQNKGTDYREISSEMRSLLSVLPDILCTERISFLHNRYSNMVRHRVRITI